MTRVTMPGNRLRADCLICSSRRSLRFGLAIAASDSPSIIRCPPEVRTAASRPSSTIRRTVSTLTPSILPPPSKPRGITRRQALAAAAATGVGVGVVRLIGGSMQQIGSPHTASTATDWISPLGSESARVMHLLRRTTMGYTPAQLDAALSDGFNRTVDRLIETKAAEPPALAAANTPGCRFAIDDL